MAGSRSVEVEARVEAEVEFDDDPDYPAMAVLKFGQRFNYTILNFSVITVLLRHATVQIEDHSQDKPGKLADVFFKEDAEALTPMTLVEVIEACFVDVSCHYTLLSTCK